MEIQITSTDRIVAVDGVECRLWEGITAGGVCCVVMVHRIAVAQGDDCVLFERELQSIPKPRHFHAEPVDNPDPLSIVTDYVDAMTGGETA